MLSVNIEETGKGNENVILQLGKGSYVLLFNTSSLYIYIYIYIYIYHTSNTDIDRML